MNIKSGVVDGICYTDALGNSVSTPITVFNVDCSSTVSFTFKMEDPHPEWNCKPSNYMPYDIFCNTHGVIIVNIDIIVPDKVVEVTIQDGSETFLYKQVCKEPDVFDLKFALALAYAKHQVKKWDRSYTLAGVENYAHECLWKYDRSSKEINRALKAYKKWLKEEDRKKAEEEERKAIIERRRAKNKKRKEKMAMKKKEEEINTIAEAIRRSR